MYCFGRLQAQQAKCKKEQQKLDAKNIKITAGPRPSLLVPKQPEPATTTETSAAAAAAAASPSGEPHTQAPGGPA